MILDLKDTLRNLTDSKKVNECVNDAILHLTSEPKLNKYQTQRIELLYLNFFVQAEYQLKERNSPEDTLNLYRTLAIIARSDKDLYRYLEIERSWILNQA